MEPLMQKSARGNLSASFSHPTMNIPQLQQLLVYEYNSGIYEGEYTKNQREGRGVYYWFSGQVYIGEWKGDTISGQGTLYFPYGGNFVGFFKNNKADGEGVLTLLDGSRIAGTWKQGRVNGMFVRYNPSSDSWGLLHSDDYYEIFRHGSQNSNYKRPANMQQFYGKSQGYSQPSLNVSRVGGGLFGNTGDISMQIEQIYERVMSSIDTAYYRAMTQRLLGENVNEIDRFKIRVQQIEDDVFFHGIVRGSRPEGLGIMFSMNGRFSVRGKFVNTKLNGPGRVELKSGEIYDGVFRNGNIQTGFYYFARQNAYVAGTFKRDALKNSNSKGTGYPYKLALQNKCRTFQRMMIYKNVTEEILILIQSDIKQLRIIDPEKYSSNDDEEDENGQGGEEIAEFQEEQDQFASDNFGAEFQHSEDQYPQEQQHEAIADVNAEKSVETFNRGEYSSQLDSNIDQQNKVNQQKHIMNSLLGQSVAVQYYANCLPDQRQEEDYGDEEVEQVEGEEMHDDNPDPYLAEQLQYQMQYEEQLMRIKQQEQQEREEEQQRFEQEFSQLILKPSKTDLKRQQQQQPLQSKPIVRAATSITRNPIEQRNSQTHWNYINLTNAQNNQGGYQQGEENIRDEQQQQQGEEAELGQSGDQFDRFDDEDNPHEGGLNYRVDDDSNEQTYLNQILTHKMNVDNIKNEKYDDLMQMQRVSNDIDQENIRRTNKEDYFVFPKLSRKTMQAYSDKIAELKQKIKEREIPKSKQTLPINPPNRMSFLPQTSSIRPSIHSVQIDGHQAKQLTQNKNNQVLEGIEDDYDDDSYYN